MMLQVLFSCSYVTRIPCACCSNLTLPPPRPRLLELFVALMIEIPRTSYVIFVLQRQSYADLKYQAEKASLAERLEKAAANGNIGCALLVNL